MARSAIGIHYGTWERRAKIGGGGVVGQIGIGQGRAAIVS